MAEIFISYSRKDSAIVLEVVDVLEHNGFSVWIDRDGIESGDAFKNVIVRALDECKVVLFFSSEASNKSPWTEKEINVAIENKLPIIPIRLDMVKYSPSVRFDLSGLDYIDLTIPEKKIGMLDRLVKSLKIKLQHEDVAPVVEIVSPPVDQEKTEESLPADFPGFQISSEDLALSSEYTLTRKEGLFSRPKYGYVNMVTNKIVIKPVFEDGDLKFDCGVARVKKNGKWGCINHTGAFIIPPTFDSLSEFAPKMVAKRDGLYGAIDFRGDTIIPFSYDYLPDEYTSRMVAGKQGRYGVIDDQNNVIVPFDFSRGDITINDEVSFKIRKNGRYGLYSNGTFVFPCDYSDIELISPGVYALHTVTKCYVGNLKGERTSQSVWPLHREWMLAGNNQLLVSLEKDVRRQDIGLKDDGSIIGADKVAVVAFDKSISLFPLEDITQDNGRVFARANKLWGELHIPSINGSLFSTERFKFLTPFCYKSIDELKKSNG